MLYLLVQIWFWVGLSAAIGLVVGLKLQQRKATFATANQPADVARLDRELSQARAETQAARTQVEGLKSRINGLESNLSQNAADTGATDTRAEEAEAQTQVLNRRIAELEDKLSQAATTIAHNETSNIEAAPPAATSETGNETTGLRGQIASLENELEAALPAEDVTEDATAPTTDTLPPHGLKEPVDGTPDNLKRINGVGVKMEAKLFELGIYHYRQLAAFTDQDVAWVDEQLTTRGRIAREDWAGQATVLLEEQDEDAATTDTTADTRVA